MHENGSPNILSQDDFCLISRALLSVLIGRVFLQGALAWVKNSLNSIGKRNFMQPMGRPKHALEVGCFFPLKFGEEADCFSFSLVPNVFLLCSL